MSDSNAKFERSGTGAGTGASGVADEEIDIALEGLEEVEPAVPLPAPRAQQAEHDIDVALDSLGDEPSPSMVMEVDRALGALEPMPSVVVAVPAAAEDARPSQSEDDAELDLALGALEPEPSVVVALPETEPAPQAAQGEDGPVLDPSGDAPADNAEVALDALGESPGPVAAESEVPLEALGKQPAPAELPVAPVAQGEVAGGGAQAEAAPASEAAAELEVPATAGEIQNVTAPVIASSASETHGAEDMGAAQQIQQVEVGQGGGISPTPELLRSLVPGMVRAAAAILGASDPDLDDVVQQSLIGFVQALPAFRGECGPARFASRIVARTACAARRRRAVQASRRVDEVDVDALEALSPSQPSALVAERRRAALRELLADIPEEQAETLSLRVVFGFSLEEVAETTGVPVNTVRSRVRLAKEALRSRIDERPALRELLEVES